MRGSVAAGVASPRFASLVQGEGGDAERGERIGPPPAHRGVEDETAEQDGGQVGAQLGLVAVSDDGVAVQPPSGVALGHRQRRHDEQRRDGQRDAGR